jgi:histidinol-phosphatase (PHP family)
VGSFYDEWLPAKEIVDLYIAMGGRLFTLGSDAHKSEKIGNGFEAVKAYLRQKGIHHLMYYKNRVPHQYSI